MKHEHLLNRLKILKKLKLIKQYIKTTWHKSAKYMNEHKSHTIQFNCRINKAHSEHEVKFSHVDCPGKLISKGFVVNFIQRHLHVLTPRSKKWSDDQKSSSEMPRFELECCLLGSHLKPIVKFPDYSQTKKLNFDDPRHLIFFIYIRMAWSLKCVKISVSFTSIYFLAKQNHICCLMLC